MAKTPEQKIAELQAARDKINAKLQAEQAKKRNKERKDENRKKIIVGAVVREHAKRDPEFRRALDKILDSHVTRQIDRELLELRPLNKKAAE